MVVIGEENKMVDLFKKVCVVIIGGGVVGCLILYYLVKKGWIDCVFIEKNEFMVGLIWYVVGNVLMFFIFWVIMNM